VNLSFGTESNDSYCDTVLQESVHTINAGDSGNERHITGIFGRI
jgi:hypothetical protein